MDVLELLKEQMVFLLNSGRTKPDEFRNQLMGKGYPDPGTTLTTFTRGNGEVDAFSKEVRGSGMSDSLLIPQSEFRFDIISLQRLGSTTWLNDDIVLACNEQEVMRQNDTHSCGLSVIKNARDRMMGRPVSGESHCYDPIELRMEALRILQSAWRDSALVVLPMEDTHRKRKPKHNGIVKTYKRQKTRTM
ncbi:hypothetical protein HYE68_000605 [Fusarium pseudograminearum]|nr:hypothetical protein HYE68_000605 [Fusarium pseudograminearum]